MEQPYDGQWTGALEVIAAGAEQAEHDCRLSDATFAALQSTGVLCTKLPKELGGADASLRMIFDQLETVARVDGSTAWVGSTMGTSSAWPAAHLPDDGVAEILGDGDEWPQFAGTFVTSGDARPEPGGFRVSGRWGFASGIHHADWLVAGCNRSDGGGQVWCVLPIGAVMVIDTWDTIGLRGTGSCDYVVSDVFVPAARTFDGLVPPPRRGGRIHRLPILAFLTPDHTAVTLGNARRTLDCLAALAAGQRLGSASALGARGAVRRDLGRADASLRAARALVHEVLETLDACDEVDPALVVEARAVATFAAEVSVTAATVAYRYAGAHAVLRSSALGRAYRDTMTSSQHIYVTDESYEQRADELLKDLKEQ
jgi:alkylation response protein AidB-like acyl-CoA dehydrogenase